MSVEVDDAYRAVPIGIRDGGATWPGDPVITSQDDGDGPALKDLRHEAPDVGVGPLGVADQHLGVPVVGHPQVLEGIDPDVQVVEVP